MSQLVKLLLAAGESKRMGQAKQLLEWQGQALLVHTVEALRELPGPTFVVTGAHREQVESVLAGQKVQLIHCPDWHRGMGISLAHGLHEVLHLLPDVDRVLIALGDQPGLKARHYAELENCSTQFPHEIIAAQYNNRPGAPILFPASFFPELLSLIGDQGARKIVRAHPDLLHLIPLPEAAFDVDTPEDWNAWLNAHPE